MNYVALLRGINVGGNNLIPMPALRAAFGALGFADVRTYIQSGNVVFSSKATPTAKLTATIERALRKAFAYDATVVVLTSKALARIVEEAPAGFGKDPKRYRYDVLFFRPPLTPKAALASVPVKPGVDLAHAGADAIYVRRLTARASQSRLARIAQSPIYKSITIRSWTTTTKLLDLVSGPAAAKPTDVFDGTPDRVRPILVAAREVVREIAKGAEEIPCGMARPRSPSMMWKHVRFAIDGTTFATLGSFREHASLFFARGAEIRDDANLLQGTGPELRYLTLRSVADARAPATRRIVRRAFALGPAIDGTTRRRPIQRS